MAKILLADDEEAITSELAPYLERSGFTVAVAHDGEEALQMAVTLQPALIILDVLMPKLNEREVCRRLRTAGNWTPVIILTQIGTSSERAMTLEEGADDYLNKPFDPFELVARIKAILRRSKPDRQPLIQARRLVCGALDVDRSSRRAFLNNKELALTSKAFAVLEYLMLHPDEVIRRERLLDEVWGWEYPAATRAVDVRIAELRKTLNDNLDKPQYIETVVNEGYRFLGSVEAHS